MKRNILAVVIPALLVAGTANAAEIFNKDGNKLDLYGKVDVRHQFADKRSKEDGDDSYARIGVKGETQITDQLTGFGRWEYNVKAKGTEKDGADSSTRLAFAGLKFANYGSLDYGRNYGVNYDVNAWTDVLPIFGGDSMAQTDNFMTGRSTGLLTYRNTDFFGLVDGLNFALQYQGQNSDRTKNGRETIRANGDGYGLSTTYDVGYGITVGGSYANSARTSLQKPGVTHVEDGKTYGVGLGKRAEAWNLGAKYDANNVYLAAMYGETRNMTRFSPAERTSDLIANKTQNIELTAQYLFSDLGLKPSLAYVQSKGKDLGEVKGKGVYNADLVKYVSVGTYYYFNKNLSTYVDYKINLLKKDNELGLNARNVFGVGLTYQF
ncbi:outer membrane porin precursor [Xenorhabdus mauleonii]|uniref:Outer membrane pore protein F n=1 Tax=Xenorhabdus mauleonii TaxID=351675 RepID=A0A1I3I0B7_9GAMM|nr:porin [Xenorhabdus mauleonii]PHM40204.1 outer membrane porin precursor [Xenorhabdus mauleonii]SFI41273.1 outer membrane pore protein F [Xenorhabdus mauleonii]